MSAVTQPLRDEHRELIPHIEALLAAADAVGEAPPGAVRAAVDAAHDFLVHHLVPHAEAEERALYPVVAKLLGAPEATHTMARDHVELRELTARLGALRQQLGTGSLPAEQARALRRVLYGLYALVHVHFAKEEEVYLPILDARLAPDDAARMFAAMGHAAGEAKAHAH